MIVGGLKIDMPVECLLKEIDPDPSAPTFIKTAHGIIYRLATNA